VKMIAIVGTPGLGFRGEGGARHRRPRRPVYMYRPIVFCLFLFLFFM
jgi:hypothetical protein